MPQLSRETTRAFPYYVHTSTQTSTPTLLHTHAETGDGPSCNWASEPALLYLDEPHERGDVPGALPEHWAEQRWEDLQIYGRQGLAAELNQLRKHLEDVRVELLHVLWFHASSSTPIRSMSPVCHGRGWVEP